MMPDGYPLDTHQVSHGKKKWTIGGLENKMPTSLHGHYIFRNARRASCFFEMPIATLHFNPYWIGNIALA